MKKQQASHAIGTDRAFYVTLGLCVLIFFGSLFSIWRAVVNTRAAQSNEAPTIVSAPIEESIHDNPVAAPAEEQVAPAAAQAEPAPQVAAVTAPVAVAYSPTYVRPTSGAVLTPFSGDELLYQPTLGDWRVHTGTDFAAKEGEEVLALTDGTVLSVYEDALYGTVVKLQHPADLTTSYSGIEQVRVKPGDVVGAGSVLGVCAPSLPIEQEQGAHIHLEARRAGTCVNVLELLGEDGAE